MSTRLPTRNLHRDLAIVNALGQRKSYRQIGAEQGVSFQRVHQIVTRITSDIYFRARRPLPENTDFIRNARRHPVMLQRVVEQYAEELGRDLHG